MIAPNGSTSRKNAARGTSLRRFAAWGALAAMLMAAIVVLCLSNTSQETEVRNDVKRTRIVDAAQVLASRPQKHPSKSVQVPEKPSSPLPPQRVGELRDGYRLLPDGTLHRVRGIVTNTPPRMSLADKTFTHSADVELGNLLMVEPGEDLLGDSEGMYRGFGKELDAALAEPIYYDKDDTELQRELKEGVNELRNELVERRKAGEDIEQLMEDTRNQLKELALYKQELEDQVRTLSTEDLTQSDYEDLLAAANQMLADRGIKPLEMPVTLKHAIRLRMIQEEAVEREQEREQSKAKAQEDEE